MIAEEGGPRIENHTIDTCGTMLFLLQTSSTFDRALPKSQSNFICRRIHTLLPFEFRIREQSHLHLARTQLGCGDSDETHRLK